MAISSKRDSSLSDDHIQWTDAEGIFAIFDRQAQSLMNLSGEEFLRRWNAGEFDDIADDPDHPEIMYLAMLAPGGR